MPTAKPRPRGRILLSARWVVGHAGGRHRLIENGEVVFDDGRIVFVGREFPGEVARRVDYGNAMIGPGFVDLDALSDLDTTILAFDNQPAWKKGRVWPRSYVEAGPFEMYSREELAFQKRSRVRHADPQWHHDGIADRIAVLSRLGRDGRRVLRCG